MPRDTDLENGVAGSDTRPELAARGRRVLAHARSAAGWLARSRPMVAVREWISPAGGFGLSAKLLALTILFVMLAEVLIFVPSIANYRVSWLTDRLVAAQLASLAAEVAPGGVVPDHIRKELLATAKVRMVALKRNNQRRLVLDENMNEPIDASYDLRNGERNGGLPSLFVYRLGLISDALAVFTANDARLIRVIGQPNMETGDFIEVVLPQGPLKMAMIRHGINVLGLSILISVITGWLVYVTLNAQFVRPTTRITHNMLRFSENPEDASRIIVPSERTDEIGTAERELAHMQRELNQMLAQKSRLAALGLAVSKINHDLRNMLANAQLVSDNLASLPDPRVQRFAPKLIASLDRAINFCNETLRFGRITEQSPRRELMLLRPLVEEVGDGLGLPRGDTVRWDIEISPTLRADADRDQLYRVLSNLARNAMQAIELQVPPAPGCISVRAVRTGRRVTIEIGDDGPGVPKLAREHLFQAFQGSTRRGGSGLGLAIAHELIGALGGTIELADPPADGRGACFRIAIPDRNPAA